MTNFTPARLFFPKQSYLSSVEVVSSLLKFFEDLFVSDSTVIVITIR